MKSLARMLRRGVVFAAVLSAAVAISASIAIYALDARLLIAIPISVAMALIGTAFVLIGLDGFPSEVEIWGYLAIERHVSERLSMVGIPFFLAAPVISIFH